MVLIALFMILIISSSWGGSVQPFSSEHIKDAVIYRGSGTACWYSNNISNSSKTVYFKIYCILNCTVDLNFATLPAASTFYFLAPFFSVVFVITPSLPWHRDTAQTAI